MLLTVIAIWLGLSVPAAIFVAALGRSGLREDEARGLLPPPDRRPAAPDRRPPLRDPEPQQQRHLVA